MQTTAEMLQASPPALSGTSYAAGAPIPLPAPAGTTRCQFVVDDIQYQVTVTPEGKDACFRIGAELGYLPYTAQCPDRRRDIMTILRATQGLSLASFRVDDAQKIVVAGESRMAPPFDLDGILYEVVRFQQEIRPYLRLLGEYL